MELFSLGTVCCEKNSLCKLISTTGEWGPLDSYAILELLDAYCHISTKFVSIVGFLLYNNQVVHNLANDETDFDQVLLAISSVVPFFSSHMDE